MEKNDILFAALFCIIILIGIGGYVREYLQQQSQRELLPVTDPIVHSFSSLDMLEHVWEREKPKLPPPTYSFSVQEDLPVVIVCTHNVVSPYVTPPAASHEGSQHRVSVSSLDT
jgi:hypothetical protein